MDDDNVVDLVNFVETGDSVEDVLEGAREKVKSNLVVLGWDEDDSLYVSAATSTNKDVLWLLEVAKKFILES